MAVTLAQIAKTCGLSAVTVSVILRNPDDHRYTPQTRERVLKTAKAMDYVPNFAARSLRKGRSMMLALVIPWNNTELMDEVQRAAHSAGYGLIVEFTPEPHPEAENKALEIALSRQVDGLIWMPANSISSKKDLSALVRRQLSRTVFLSCCQDIMPELNRVYIDYHIDLKYAVEYFVAEGCREILHTATVTEMMGFQFGTEIEKHCKKNGIVFSMVAEKQIGNLCRQTMEHLSSASHRIGILGTDWSCLEAISACSRLGKNIPGEVSLLSFSDNLIGGRYRLGELASPSLTAIQIPFGELGRQAVKAVVQLQTDSPQSPISVCLPTKFIQRASTRAVELCAPLSDNGAGERWSRGVTDVSLTRK